MHSASAQIGIAVANRFPNITLTAEAGYQPYRTFDFYRADVEFDQENSAPYGTLSIHGSF